MSIKTKFLLLFWLRSLIFALFAYYIIDENLQLLERQHETETKNIFYELTLASQDFLAALMKSYEQQKKRILNDHKKALAYFDTHPLDGDLGELRQLLKDRYHIFVTDNNFTIVNTTYPLDQNFSIAFAKENLLKHKHSIGVSPPICEPATATFFTYTDSFVPFGGERILQLGYVYDHHEIQNLRQKLELILATHKEIKDFSIYFVFPQLNFAQECNILNPPGKKPPLEHSLKVNENILPIHSLLTTANLLGATKGDTRYFYMLGKNILNDQGDIVYKIAFDERPFLTQKTNKILFLIILIFFILISVATFYHFIKKWIIDPIANLAQAIKEKRLAHNGSSKDEIGVLYRNYNSTFRQLNAIIQEKKTFLNHAIHELKTPLAVISLNNDLQPKDIYSHRIKTAVKQLRSAYENMVFYQKLNTIKRNKEPIEICSILQERAHYFNDLATMENKELFITCRKDRVCMDRHDIQTLIDNNLSNAIKYSASSRCYVKYSNKKLVFYNEAVIERIEHLKDEFYRENREKGGFGIGLAIVAEICDFYGIKFDIKQKNGWVYFIYDFGDVPCE